jgi:hypothetical protein
VISEQKNEKTTQRAPIKIKDAKIQKAKKPKLKLKFLAHSQRRLRGGRHGDR